MGEIVKMFINQGLLSPIQLVILIIDAYLLLTGHHNSFVLLSFLVIISTFVLQAVKGRFLLLLPKNNWVGRESSEIDTYYLRSIIILSTLFVCIGVFVAYLININRWVHVLEENLKHFLPIAGFIFIVIIPVVFWIFSERIDKRVATKLKRYGPYTFVRQCPFCSKGFALQTNEVIDRNRGRSRLICSQCQVEEEREVSLNIGLV
jgi:hypothetical protein